MEYKPRQLSSTVIYFEDLERIRRLKQKRNPRPKWLKTFENNADVVSKALDALGRERVAEGKEKNEREA